MVAVAFPASRRAVAAMGFALVAFDVSDSIAGLLDDNKVHWSVSLGDEAYLHVAHPFLARGPPRRLRLGAISSAIIFA